MAAWMPLEDPALAPLADEAVDQAQDAGRGDAVSDGNNSEEEEYQQLQDSEDPAHDIEASRWAFLSQPFDRWFDATRCAVAPTSTTADPRFGSFRMFLPWSVLETDTLSLREVRYDAQLVSAMFRIDPSTYWFTKRRKSWWFRAFEPAAYDLDRLVPKMTFAMHRRRWGNDDQPAAVKRLQYVLVDCEDNGDLASCADDEDTWFRADWDQITAEEDPTGRLRGFQCPIAFELQPQRPETALELQTYLRDTITLAQRVLAKQRDPKYPFKLEDIRIKLHMVSLTEIHSELRELFSLGVPVTLRLRHSCEDDDVVPAAVAWPRFGPGANLFTAFADDPAARERSDEVAIHTLDSTEIFSSFELWSAVAFSRTLRALTVQPSNGVSPAFYEALARWMAFALAHSSSLRSLDIAAFRFTSAELDAMEHVLTSPVPARILPACAQALSGKFQFVRLQTDAAIHSSYLDGPQTMAQLRLDVTWRFPVVRTLDLTGEIEIIVPGHAIARVSASAVVEWEDAPPEIYHRDTRTGLETLVLANDHVDTGITGRFVGLFGRKLRELSWYGGDQASDHFAFDKDLEQIARACPQLERLTIQTTRIASLACLTRSLSLVELSLVRSPVPMASLVGLFGCLGDRTRPLASSLERFSYYCPTQQLDATALEAALAMLSTNRRLVSITLGVREAIYDTYDAQLDAAGQVVIAAERLDLVSKLAFLSVVRHEPFRAIGLLDSDCLGRVFKCFGRSVERRIQVFTDEE